MYAQLDLVSGQSIYFFIQSVSGARADPIAPLTVISCFSGTGESKIEFDRKLEVNVATSLSAEINAVKLADGATRVAHGKIVCDKFDILVLREEEVPE